MNNDLKVSLENIIPLTYARDHFSSIVAEVQRDKLYILTKGGKPAIALIDVRYLEQITAGVFNKAKIEKDIEKIPEQVGKPKMLEHGLEIKDEKLKVKDAKTELNKPAGYAAPQPKIEPKPPPPPAGFAAPKKEEFDLNKDLPKDNPPDLSKKTIPVTEKQPDTANKPLAFPENEIKKPSPASNPASNQNATPTIDVNFNQDVNTDKQEKVFTSDGLSPDDRVQPAQYAGEKPEEPEEMAID